MLTQLPSPLFVALALAAASPRPTRALATEQLGNAPIAIQWAGFGADLLAAVNAPERVYWYEVNGNPTFYFRGDAAALNEAVRRFAALELEPGIRREVVLLPGPGERRTFDGRTRVGYGWSVHVPMGLRFAQDPEVGDTRAVLAVHVPAPRPAPVADAPAVRRAVADLDRPDYRVRERAANELRALGPGAAPLLRAALARAATPESRRRLEALLAPHDGVQLDLLAIPAGVTVVGPDELMARYRKGLAAGRADVRGYAAAGLAGSGAAPADVVPLLVGFVEREGDGSALASAAGALAGLGPEARPAEVALRARAAGLPEPARASLAAAADRLAAAKGDPPGPTDLGVIRRDIRAFVAARGGEAGR